MITKKKVSASENLQGLHNLLNGDHHFNGNTDNVPKIFVNGKKSEKPLQHANSTQE